MLDLARSRVGEHEERDRERAVAGAEQLVRPRRRLGDTRDDSAEEREYGLRMLVISRCVERIGDHAVDIGEQVVYLVTGEFREFSDASHPA